MKLETKSSWLYPSIRGQQMKVTWDELFPIKGKKQHVPNHQPDMYTHFKGLKILKAKPSPTASASGAPPSDEGGLGQRDQTDSSFDWNLLFAWLERTSN